MTLTEFLLARITEREWLARRAWADSGWQAEGVRVTSPRDVVAKVGDERTAQFIVANRPARVLAECEAKRRIVELSAANDNDWGVEQSVRLLAAVYADHPDYREEWKP